MAGRQTAMGKRNQGNGDADIESYGQNGHGTGYGPGAKTAPSLVQDLPSICLLLLLYTLQGIPLGLSGSVPFLLAGKVLYNLCIAFGVSCDAVAIMSVCSVQYQCTPLELTFRQGLTERFFHLHRQHRISSTAR